MKIRIDQNLSFRAARAIEAALPNRAGFEVSYVGDVHPPGTSDPDWLRAFANEGGTAIVSGDFNILKNYPDLVAYTETGLISFFPVASFEKLNRFGKVAFIIRWWPAIVEKTKQCQPGDRWRLPMHWNNPDHTKMQFLPDPRVDGRTVKSPDDSNVVPIKKENGRAKG